MSPGTLLSSPRPPESTRETSHPGSTITPGRGARFGLLLLVLMFTYVLSAFTRGTWVAAFQIGAFVVVAALALRISNLRRGTARLVIIAALGGSAVAITLALTHSADAVGGVGQRARARQARRSRPRPGR